ncbi:MAG: YfhO family protein, partial [Clostridia bacterium]|nr:YfhO family protein [Clostridia bacterium]
KVFVDGEKVDTYELFQALVAFDAEPGTHELVIKYVPTELYIGTAISDSCAVILAVIFICDIRRKKRKNFEVEIIELTDEEIKEEK